VVAPRTQSKGNIMKKILITALFATSCLTVPALAQTAPAETTTPPAATTTDTAPAGTVPAAGGMQTMDGGMQSEGGFYTYQEGNQVLGSGLMGADVQGADGEDIGTVNDLLLDRDGQILAVVVGVGGFLGIGEKDVAIANDQLNFVLAQEAAAADGAAAPADGTAAPAATGTAPAATAPVDGTAPAATTATPAPAGTADGTAPAGTTATGMGTTTTMDNTGAAGARDTGFGWTGAGIDHIQVTFTRQQLEDAPAFEAAE
jgi:hypothetical protein